MACVRSGTCRYVFRMELWTENYGRGGKQAKSSVATQMQVIRRGGRRWSEQTWRAWRGRFSGSYAVCSVPGAGLAVLWAVRVGGQAVVRGHIRGALWWVIVLGEGWARGHAVTFLERTEWQQCHCLLTGDTERISIQGGHVTLLGCTCGSELILLFRAYQSLFTKFRCRNWSRWQFKVWRYPIIYCTIVDSLLRRSTGTIPKTLFTLFSFTNQNI